MTTRGRRARSWGKLLFDNIFRPLLFLSLVSFLPLWCRFFLSPFLAFVVCLWISDCQGRAASPSSPHPPPLPCSPVVSSQASYGGRRRERPKRPSYPLSTPLALQRTTAAGRQVWGGRRRHRRLRAQGVLDCLPVWLSVYPYSSRGTHTHVHSPMVRCAPAAAACCCGRAPPLRRGNGRMAGSHPCGRATVARTAAAPPPPRPLLCARLGEGWRRRRSDGLRRRRRRAHARRDSGCGTTRMGAVDWGGDGPPAEGATTRSAATRAGRAVASGRVTTQDALPPAGKRDLQHGRRRHPSASLRHSRGGVGGCPPAPHKVGATELGSEPLARDDLSSPRCGGGAHHRPHHRRRRRAGKEDERQAGRDPPRTAGGRHLPLHRVVPCRRRCTGQPSRHPHAVEGGHPPAPRQEGDKVSRVDGESAAGRWRHVLPPPPPTPHEQPNAVGRPRRAAGPAM